MYITKSEIAEVEYDFLHDALYMINRIFPSFRSCYMDKDGELALQFDSRLSCDDVRGVLFELNTEFLSPYAPAPVGPSAERAEYFQDYEYDSFNKRTTVYSRDGVDYRAI